jgi:hypothetical protein
MRLKAAMNASEGRRNAKATFAPAKLAAADANACAQGVDISSTAAASITTGVCRSRAPRNASVMPRAAATSATAVSRTVPSAAMRSAGDPTDLRDLRPGIFGTMLNIPLTIDRVANAQREKRKRGVT